MTLGKTERMRLETGGGCNCTKSCVWHLDIASFGTVTQSLREVLRTEM